MIVLLNLCPGRGLKWIPRQPMHLHKSLDVSFEDLIARTQIHYSFEASEASRTRGLPPDFVSFANAFIECEAKNRSTEDLTSEESGHSFPGLIQSLSAVKEMLKQSLAQRYEILREESANLRNIKEIWKHNDWIVKPSDKNTAICLI